MAGVLSTLVVPAHPYRRTLPHIFPARTAVFFTWRLYGSLPVQKHSIVSKPKVSTGATFVRMDRSLDRAATGPRWLRDPRIAEIVTGEIERGEREFGRYRLLEYVVMPNHVHVLVFPTSNPDAAMRMLKGNTARLANRLLDRVGLPFWQYESFDHWCRSVEEVRKIRAYIVNDPVKCGLVRRPQDWRWSSAHRRLEEKQARLVQRVTGVAEHLEPT